MTPKRDAVLNGIGRAAELHAELGLRDKLGAGDRPVDVLAAIHKLSIMLLFRPLEGLLGAYVPTPRSAGILITTKRDHHVQRFTAAHELGHHVLNHLVPSIDKKVGFVARGERDGYEWQEVEADAFAAEFLLPKWLIAAHARRQKWGRQDLRQPDVIYQLSLRLGASFSATCWALASAGILPQNDARNISLSSPKSSKQRAINGVQPKSWHPDVWVLSDQDQGIQVLGNPDDFLVFALKEHVASGYQWNIESIAQVGLSIQADDRREAGTDVIGAATTRHLVAQGKGPALGRLRLEERRPWETHQHALNALEVDLALLGRDPVGLPRPERLLAA